MLWKCGGFVLLSDTLPFEEVSKRCVRNFQQSWERHGRLAGDVLVKIEQNCGVMETVR